VHRDRTEAEGEAMSAISRSAPKKGAALRRALYGGEIFLLPPSDASLALVDAVYDVVREELGASPRRAHERFDDAALFVRVGRIRRVLFLEERFHRMAREVISACGYEPEGSAFDPLRLRVVTHRGHENPRAKAVYYPHRDTWYGHSQAIVTWWIPLDDLPEEQTFVFYPERFEAPVPNDSEIFDYDEWVKEGWDLKIGWQNRDHGLTARYPGVTGEVDPGDAVGFSCVRGENLLFSGAHFHATRPQTQNVTRFSLDFRVVHLDDVRAGRGAPNVDNRSSGSALDDYVMPDEPR
jgi:hypothetical protein